jgi:CheY-like chemotaxis protein
MTQILMVDDSMYQRHKARHALEAEGYDLVEAANGHEGLEMIAVNSPDCILLDLIMPEMGGLEVLQALRDRGSSIPVVVLTADIQESTRQRCLELGTSAFINKPLQEAELVNTVKRVLDSPTGKEEAAQ